jgi:lysophospholipase L1-like esterase
LRILRLVVLFGSGAIQEAGAQCFPKASTSKKTHTNQPLNTKLKTLKNRDLGGVTADKPMIVLLGDSITEFGAYDGGWQLRMTGAYTRKADVINRGFSGYNSRWGTFLVDEILTALGGGARVKLCTVFFGANDAAGPDTSV